MESSACSNSNRFYHRRSYVGNKTIFVQTDARDGPELDRGIGFHFRAYQLRTPTTLINIYIDYSGTVVWFRGRNR